MSKFSLLFVLSASFLAACAADRGEESATSQNDLRRAKSSETQKGGPQLPAVCSQTNENACLADEGCAWGDQGDGPRCFYVGRIDAQPEGPELPHATPGPELPHATPAPGTEPTWPTVCTHNTTESSCLNDPGCAWGEQGKGPKCFFVGEVVPYAK